MSEILDAIIGLLSIIEYGPFINRWKNFKSMLKTFKEVADAEADVYRSYVDNELGRLKVRPYAKGKPKFAIFEKGSQGTKVYILNEQAQFMFRLKDYFSVENSFFVNLNVGYKHAQNKSMDV